MSAREKARSFSRRDDWTAARVYFEEEARRAPRDAEARAYLGFYCMKESRYDTKRALADYAAALDSDAACATAYLLRGVTLGSLQDPQAAFAALREAERLGAAPEDLTWARASVELDAGSVEKAVEGFRRLVELEGDSTSMILLSQAFSQARNNEEALAWARKAFAADPEDFRAPTYAGVYLAYLRRLDEARAEFAKALKLTADYPLLHHARAYVALQEGKADEAERHLRRTLVLDPEYVTSRKMLADLCAGSGRVAEAREHYRRALETFPAYKETWEALRRLGG